MTQATDHVVLLHYRVPMEVIEELLPAHRAWLDIGFADGVFYDCGPREPRTGGVIIARDLNRDALDRRLAQDPFALAGAATYETVTFRGRGAT